MAVRAKDIAEELGASTATLSLVLNGKPGISEKTRKKVLQGINALGYGYLVQEQQAGSEENKTIGFVIYKNSGELLGMNSFFPLILDGIEFTARQYGYNLVVINIDRKEIDTQIQFIKDANCRGYVIFATEMQEEEVSFFERLQIPFVLFDNYFIDKQINSVKANNEQGTYLAVKHLYEMGHRKIGYLGSGLDIRSFIERRKYAFSAMESFGLSGMERYSFDIGYPHERAESGMASVLEKIPREELPTAFMSDNDLVAIGAMQAVKRHGYKIPDDISFIGYDDRPVCTLSDPKLSTICLPKERFGAEAVEQLIYVIQKGWESCIKIEINGNLIERDSVRNMNK